MGKNQDCHSGDVSLSASISGVCLEKGLADFFESNFRQDEMSSCWDKSRSHVVPEPRERLARKRDHEATSSNLKIKLQIFKA